MAIRWVFLQIQKRLPCTADMLIHRVKISHSSTLFNTKKSKIRHISMPLHKWCSHYKSIISTEIVKASLMDRCLLPHAPTALGRISPSRSKPFSAASILNPQQIRFTCVMEGRFSFPFLASVSSPFSEENKPFLFLTLWDRDRVRFLRAASSLEQIYLNTDRTSLQHFHKSKILIVSTTWDNKWNFL